MSTAGMDDASIETIEEAVLEVIGEASAALASLAGSSAIESELFAHAAAHLDPSDGQQRSQLWLLVDGLEEMFSTLRLTAQAQESLYEGLGSLSEVELGPREAEGGLEPVAVEQVWSGLAEQATESLLDPCGPDCTCDEAPEADEATEAEMDMVMEHFGEPGQQDPAEEEVSAEPDLDLELAEEVKSRLRARAGAEVIARALALAADGASTAQIAVEAGVSTSTVSRWTLTAAEVVAERPEDDEFDDSVEDGPVDPAADEQLLIDFDPEFDEPAHEVDADEGPEV